MAGEEGKGDKMRLNLHDEGQYGSGKSWGVNRGKEGKNNGGYKEPG